MARFFVDRPVFAWVVALFIALAGLLALPNLPIAQYPNVAPPAVNIRATWPGATAALLDESVTSVIEQELNGAEGLLYVESSSAANGVAEIIASFQSGTNADMAAVDVQNRLKKVEARLPQSIRQQGVDVTKASAGFLVVGILHSPDESYNVVQLGDYIARTIVPEVRRIKGVGEVRQFGTEHAMRVWVDPAALVAHGLTMPEVTAAIQAQNVQISAGSLGDLPTVADQQITAGLVVSGQLADAESFGKVVLRSLPDGSVVRLSDVARVELGGQTYAFTGKFNGKPSSGFAVLLTPTGNALETANLVKAKMADLKAYFPQGMDYEISVDNSAFISISIEAVVHTLIEAILLVFLVMYLFLQDFRATLIPTLVVPVAILASFAAMYAFGFSINVLSMFGLVLAIGIVVDDAIVVVENVERLMSEEHLSPRDATHKAMGQITGAILGMTLVLCSVFVPMGFFGGAVGMIYRQFSLAMVSSILASAVLALTLTPALCATLLKGGHHEPRKTGFFGWFNRWFDVATERYGTIVASMLRRTGRSMLLFVVLVAVMAVGWVRLPSGFLPLEDQGTLNTIVNLMPGASSRRTEEVMDEVDAYWMQHPAVAKVLSLRGFSFSGNGQNAAIGFIALKPWDERGPELASFVAAAEGQKALSTIRDAMAFTINPPPIRELGRVAGFAFRLQDRAGQGHEALLAARDRLLAEAAKSPMLVSVRNDGLEDTSQLAVEIDRDKAAALGVPFAAIAQSLTVAFGSSYVNDFPNYGRQQRVIVQATPESRVDPRDLDDLFVANRDGQMVPLGELVSTRWIQAPVQLVRYNGYPAYKITGEAAPGFSSGAAMDEMERLAAELGPGFGFEWTGPSFEERTSGAQVPMLLSLSMLAVFLCLAALYESWSIPSAVLLVVPLGVLGAVVATSMRGLPNDVYFKVGIIAIIGLSAKNAILIVEFAKDLQAQGMGLVEATLQAVVQRFRPILMTSLAFILGVFPLVVSSGAGSASQRAIGTAVMGGMISATVLAVLLVPVFFVVVRRWFPDRRGGGES